MEIFQNQNRKCVGGKEITCFRFDALSDAMDFTIEGH